MDKPKQLGTCSQCYEPILKDDIIVGAYLEEHTKVTTCPPSESRAYQILMHVDCCPHNNCNGNYEDVWCMDCGADYNNGRLY
jgi:hypothetical protein